MAFQAQLILVVVEALAMAVQVSRALEETVDRALGF